MKKKRVGLLAIILAAIAAGFRFGAWFSVIAIAAVFAAWGAFRLYRKAVAHRSIEELRPYFERYNVEKLKADAQARDTGRPFKFVVMGDTRNVYEVGKIVFSQVATEDAAVILNTGDLVRKGTAREYLNCHLPLLELTNPAPMFCVPGNHDRGARNNFAAYNAIYGSERFAFDFGPCTFVGVNNGKRARMESDDVAYLEEHLSKSTAQYKFAVLHIPPAFFEQTFVIVRSHRGFTKWADEMHEVFKQYGVNEVFMGHIHGYASTVIDGVRYTLTAGGGAPLSKRLPKENRAFNYVVVHVGNDGLRREVVQYINGEWVRREE